VEVHGGRATGFARHVQVAVWLLQVATEAGGPDLFDNHPVSTATIGFEESDAAADQTECLGFTVLKSLHGSLTFSSWSGFVAVLVLESDLEGAGKRGLSGESLLQFGFGHTLINKLLGEVPDGVHCKGFLASFPEGSFQFFFHLDSLRRAGCH